MTKSKSVSVVVRFTYDQAREVLTAVLRSSRLVAGSYWQDLLRGAMRRLRRAIKEAEWETWKRDLEQKFGEERKVVRKTKARRRGSEK